MKLELVKLEVARICIMLFMIVAMYIFYTGIVRIKTQRFDGKFYRNVLASHISK